MPDAPDAPTLVINDGSLAGLVACLMAGERGEVVSWTPPPGSPLSSDAGASPSSADSVIDEQADLLGYRETVRADPPDLASGGAPPGTIASALLLRAVIDGAARGCRAVVWPVVAGSDLDAMAEATERAMLVTRLVWLDEAAFGAGAVTVETPLVDLTEAQVADLADDLDAPAGLWRGAPAAGVAAPDPGGSPGEEPGG